MSQQRRSNPVYGRAQIADFICPDNGFRGNQARRGIAPKDHMKENYKQLREIQNRRLDEKEMAQAAPKELYKLAQYKGVQSRVFDTPMPETSRGRPQGEVESVFLTKGASRARLLQKQDEARQARMEVKKQMEDAAYYSTAERPATPTKPSVPKKTERGLLARRDQDFVSQNRIKAQVAMPPSPLKGKDGWGDGEKAEKHSSFGRVPDYLEQRKAEWRAKEEELEKKKADKGCPPGMCLMPDDERLKTLETLELSKVEVTRQLAKCPFIVETPKARMKVESLEQRLKEIENAINLFSKPKVFVAKD